MAADTVLNQLFAGTNGISNLLVRGLGTEAAVEWRLERVWNPEKDAELEEVSRQILPVLVLSEVERTVISGGNREEEGELRILLPGAHLIHPIEPATTRILFQKKVWLVIEAKPEYAGGEIHLWELKLRRV